jgi:hypothetical protein
VVGWNISIKVMLMPLAMAAIFLRTGIPIQYTETFSEALTAGPD